MGQRVLLIDADLRKPQMHLRLGLNNLSGLSNLLADGPQSWRGGSESSWLYQLERSHSRPPPDPPGCSAHSV